MPSVDPISEATTEWPWLQFASWSDRQSFTRILHAANISSHVHIGLLFSGCCTSHTPPPSSDMDTTSSPHVPKAIELCSLGRYNPTTHQPACSTTAARPLDPFLPIQISHVPCYECRMQDLRWLSEEHYGPGTHLRWAREGVRNGPAWVDPFRRAEQVGISAGREMGRIFAGLASSLDEGAEEGRKGARKSKRKFELDGIVVGRACAGERLLYEEVSPRTVRPVVPVVPGGEGGVGVGGNGGGGAKKGVRGWFSSKRAA